MTHLFLALEALGLFQLFQLIRDSLCNMNLFIIMDK